MNGSKAGWIFPVIVLVVLIAVIWIGLFQCKIKPDKLSVNLSSSMAVIV